MLNRNQFTASNGVNLAAIQTEYHTTYLAGVPATELDVRGELPRCTLAAANAALDELFRERGGVSLTERYLAFGTHGRDTFILKGELRASEEDSL